MTSVQCGVVPLLHFLASMFVPCGLARGHLCVTRLCYPFVLVVPVWYPRLLYVYPVLLVEL